MNFLDISNKIEASNTSANIVRETSMNSPQNTRRRNPRIYTNYSLWPYNRFLYGKVNEIMQEGLIHNFWIANGGIINIRESTGLAPFSMTHENDLILEY